MLETIDREACISCGLCVSMCPDVYMLDDENIATVYAQPNDENKNCALDAAESCPTDAILVETVM